MVTLTSGDPMTHPVVRLTLHVVTAALLATPALAGDGWHTSYEDAVKEAKKTKRPILADFTGSDWCFSCKKLNREVFDTPAFKTWAKANVVLLELDYPADKSKQSAALQAQNKRLQDKYAVDRYPTIVFLDASGKELGRSGYAKGGPAKWTAGADAILAKARTPGSHASRWTEDYAAAIAKAKATGTFVLAEFTGSDWCGWCIRLRKEILQTAEFEAWAAKTVVLLELDYPMDKPQSDALKAQNKGLLKKYGVAGYPTILILNGEGEQVGQLTYERGGPTPWIQKAQKILDGAK
jgi:thiol:disulfide interchange protein